MFRVKRKYWHKFDEGLLKFSDREIGRGKPENSEAEVNKAVVHIGVILKEPKEVCLAGDFRQPNWVNLIGY